MKTFQSFCVNVITYCSTALFVVLAVCSFLKTAYVADAYQIVIQLPWDNPVFNLLFILVFGIALYGLATLFSSMKNGEKILLVLVSCWVFCASMLWVYFSKSGPAFDCGSVYIAAKQFARNDFSALAYRDSYFSVYPFQLGLAWFYEKIFRILRNDNFHILQAVNAVCLVVITVSQYYLAGYFFRKKKIQIYGLLLMASSLSFIMYGSYIYGEIPSFAFLLFGTWMLILFLENLQKKNGIATGTAHRKAFVLLAQAFLAGLSLVCSVLVRKNTLIFLIALAIILVLYLMKNWKQIPDRWHVLLPIYLVCLFALCLQIIPMVQKGYEARSNTVVNTGVPMSSYLAMGLMEADAGPGHYSGYNFETFTEIADYNTELASAMGFEAYKERLSYFASHPGYGISFLGEKFLDQWLNVGWAVYDSTYVSFGERLPIIESCFSGPLYRIMIKYMAGYQMVLYLFVAICCICFVRENKKSAFKNKSTKNFPVFSSKNNGVRENASGSRDTTDNIVSFSKSHIEQPFALLFLLTAFGGFLFYMAWEASGRYILPYALFVLPNAAYGCDYVMEWVREKRFLK